MSITVCGRTRISPNAIKLGIKLTTMEMKQNMMVIRVKKEVGEELEQFDFATFEEYIRTLTNATTVSRSMRKHPEIRTRMGNGDSSMTQTFSGVTNVT